MLAESLFGAEYNDFGGFGVQIAHLVPSVVILCAHQVSIAAVHLAPRDDRQRRTGTLPLHRSPAGGERAIRRGAAAVLPLPQLQTRQMVVRLLLLLLLLHHQVLLLLVMVVVGPTTDQSGDHKLVGKLGARVGGRRGGGGGGIKRVKVGRSPVPKSSPILHFSIFI